jgi:predicted TIM-barrel fold metal-dependent hydrolase
VYDNTRPIAAGAKLNPPTATIDDYRRIQSRMGTTRAVLVTPSTYGTDNSVMLEGLALLGEQARGVVVIEGDEPESQLAAWHAAGVRGIRVNLSLGQARDVQAIEQMAHLIAPLGWHVQLLMPLEQLLALGPVLARLPTPLVFDHFARITPSQCLQHPAHLWLLTMMREGKAWVKLSGGCLVSPTASVEDPGLDALARSFLEAAPTQVVWGSDWPHATASAGLQPMPDDARQIDRLAEWAGDEAQLRRVLVSNPARLYDLPSLSSR